MDEFEGIFFIHLQGCEFLTENGGISRHVLNMFIGCEFLMKNGWISRFVFHLFTGCVPGHSRWNPSKVQVKKKMFFSPILELILGPFQVHSWHIPATFQVYY